MSPQRSTTFYRGRTSHTLNRGMALDFSEQHAKWKPLFNAFKVLKKTEVIFEVEFYIQTVNQAYRSEMSCMQISDLFLKLFLRNLTLII